MKKNLKILNFRIFSVILVVLMLLGSSGCDIFSGDKNSSVKTIAENIPIAMASDDNYVYPTVVAITSILENTNKKTKIEIYLMHPGNFKEESKEKLRKLKEKYENLNLEFINMEDRFKNANDKGLATPTYYRLSLSSLLPNINKIIWLDGDILALDDLSDFYNLDMQNLYYRGFLDHNNEELNILKDFGIEDDHYICAGVMLINLEKLRQDNMEPKFEEFIEKNNEKLKQHDQTVINALCYKNIDILPARFGIFNYFGDTAGLRAYLESLIAKNKYSLNELIEAFKKPTVVHCVVKPWKDRNVAFSDVWWEYAQKTDLKDEIYKAYTAA